MFILSTTINIMSLKEICNEIRELKSSDEELAFERLQDILIDFMREYTCDNEFYLYSVDHNNNYEKFRKHTEILFELLYDMFYDEEQLKEVINDPTIKDEITKYFKFIESIQFFRKNIMTITLEEEQSVEVKCFHNYMNYCETYIENMYKDMRELNNVMDELNDNLKQLTNKLTNLV